MGSTDLVKAYQLSIERDAVLINAVRQTSDEQTEDLAEDFLFRDKVITWLSSELCDEDRVVADFVNGLLLTERYKTETDWQVKREMEDSHLLGLVAVISETFCKATRLARNPSKMADEPKKHWCAQVRYNAFRAMRSIWLVTRGFLDSLSYATLVSLLINPEDDPQCELYETLNHYEAEFTSKAIHLFNAELSTESRSVNLPHHMEFSTLVGLGYVAALEMFFQRPTIVEFFGLGNGRTLNLSRAEDYVLYRRAAALWLQLACAYFGNVHGADTTMAMQELALKKLTSLGPADLINAIGMYGLVDQARSGVWFDHWWRFLVQNQRTAIAHENEIMSAALDSQLPNHFQTTCIWDHCDQPEVQEAIRPFLVAATSGDTYWSHELQRRYNPDIPPPPHPHPLQAQPAPSEIMMMQVDHPSSATNHMHAAAAAVEQPLAIMDTPLPQRASNNTRLPSMVGSKKRNV